MIKKPINQNSHNNLRLLNLINYNYSFNKNPINRLKTTIGNKINSINNKKENLKKLKERFNSIKDCKIKDYSTKLVFGNGNLDSPLMIIGGVPGAEEDHSGKVFVGKDGILLEKMLQAINIKKDNIYITYAVNYRTPKDRKPNTNEIKKYSNYLQEHIDIISPKILILMGSVAMESLTGLNEKISIERNKWKEIIIKNANYNAIITFDPSYLLRFPENKKYSWEDLKKIKQKITDLNLII
jgi:uracil-DNA glycosylase